jgi:hypothetical protein
LMRCRQCERMPLDSERPPPIPQATCLNRIKSKGCKLRIARLASVAQPSLVGARAQVHTARIGQRGYLSCCCLIPSRSSQPAFASLPPALNLARFALHHGTSCSLSTTFNTALDARLAQRTSTYSSIQHRIELLPNGRAGSADQAMESQKWDGGEGLQWAWV